MWCGGQRVEKSPETREGSISTSLRTEEKQQGAAAEEKGNCSAAALRSAPPPRQRSSEFCMLWDRLFCVYVSLSPSGHVAQHVF